MTDLREPTVLLLDVDGTLVTTRGVLPASAVAAVHAARERGARAAAAPRSTPSCGRWVSTG